MDSGNRKIYHRKLNDSVGNSREDPQIDRHRRSLEDKTAEI